VVPLTAVGLDFDEFKFGGLHEKRAVVAGKGDSERN
jgi:hypothetical protein